MIYAYTRVSTGMQTLENQKYGIKEYCKRHNMKVDMWYEETISGTKRATDRVLGKLLKTLKKDDIIICTEFSRLGRSLPDVLETIRDMKQRKAVLMTIKENFILDDSLSAKILSSVLALISDISRELLSQRVREGLAARKAKGIKLGRRLGTHNKHSRLEKYRSIIEGLLKGGASRYVIKKHLSCHGHTLNSYLVESGLAKKYNIEITDNFMQNNYRLNK